MSNSINLKISRDNNGNKTVKVKRLGFRGFSVQTLGNMPKTHRDSMKGLITDPMLYCVALTELTDFVASYGTTAQKALIKG